MKPLSTAAGVLLAAIMPALAAPFVYEGFDYNLEDTPGRTLTDIDGAGADADGGEGFLSAWGNRPDIIRDTGLTHPLLLAPPDPDSNSISVNLNTRGRVFDGSTEGQVAGQETWFSFLIELPADFTASASRVMLFSSGPGMASGNGFGIEINSTGVRARLATVNSATAVPLANDTTYFVLGRYTHQEAGTLPKTVDIWVDPDPAELGSPDSSASADVSNVTFSATASGVYLRTDNPPPTSRQWIFDELRIGSGLGDVIAAPPAFTSANPVVVSSPLAGAGFHTLTASDPAGGEVTFSITGGADASQFTITPTGILSYIGNGGNFNVGSPTDADANNRYEVQITATSDSGDLLSGVRNLAVNVIASVPPTLTAGAISVTGATGTDGAFRIGDIVTVSWDNSTATGDGGGGGNGGIDTVTVDFSEFEGPAATPASLVGDTWSATYTVGAGSLDVVNANVSVTATNPSGSTTTADDTDFVFDNVAPLVTDPNILLTTVGSGGAGEFINGDPITLRWDDSSAGDANPDTAAVSFNFAAFGGLPANPAVEATDLWEATYIVAFDSIAGADLNASVTVTDDAGNVTTLADTSNVTIVNAQVLVSAVTGSTEEGSPSTTATYTINLDTIPAGAVEITVTPDVQAEVSINGVDFLPAVSFSKSDTSTETITVRAIDDEAIEGPHGALISHAITNTADTLNYPLTLVIEDATVDVIDNDVGKLVTFGGGVIPTTDGFSTFTGIDVPAATDSALFVSIGAEGGNGVQSVSFGGVELERAGVVATNNASHASVWYLVNPAVGAANLDIVWDGVPFGACGLAYYVVKEVNQEGPIALVGSSELVNGATGNNLAVTFNALPQDSVIIDALITNANVAPEVAFGPEQITGFLSGALGGGATFGSSILGKLSTGARTQSVSWTQNQRAGYVAVALRSNTVPFVSGFNQWALDNGLDGTPGKEAGFEDDPEGDSFANGLEFILGGNPLASDSVSSLYQSSYGTLGAAKGLFVTFSRNDAAEDNTSIIVEATIDLEVIDLFIDVANLPDGGWPGVVITVEENGANPDDISVFIPDTYSFDGKIFARINATQD